MHALPRVPYPHIAIPAAIISEWSHRVDGPIILWQLPLWNSTVVMRWNTIYNVSAHIRE